MLAVEVRVLMVTPQLVEVALRAGVGPCDLALACVGLEVVDICGWMAGWRAHWTPIRRGVCSVDTAVPGRRNSAK